MPPIADNGNGSAAGLSLGIVTQHLRLTSFVNGDAEQSEFVLVGVSISTEAKDSMRKVVSGEDSEKTCQVQGSPWRGGWSKG